MENVFIVGGGVGTANCISTAMALKAGNYVSVIIGARNSDYIILRDKFLSLLMKCILQRMMV